MTNLVPLLASQWSLQMFADVRHLAPEICLIIGMCVVLLVPFINRKSTTLPLLVTMITLLAALGATLCGLANATGSAFSQMLSIDPFSQFFKIILFTFTMLVITQWLLVSKDKVHPNNVPDFLCLILGAATGMSLMVSANNLLMIFVAMEAASIPSYALAGFRKNKKASTESALKYVLFGSIASAISLYGISLIYGTTGTLDLASIASTAATQGISPLMALGLTGLFAGFAFKLSAVPFHFWCPDVFQGAPIEVTTFLSVASKGAAICMLIRVLNNFAVARPDHFIGIATGIALLGAVTALWGNTAALRQTNLRRLLAYSSIAHAGYMIMAASVILLTRFEVPSAILFYVITYMFMNFGAFTVVALVAKHTGSEEMADYAGLLRRSPGLAILLTIFLLSLFGMPGLGGFMGKIFLATAMIKAGFAGEVLVAVLLFNTLISLYFYLKPVYYMVFTADNENRPCFTPNPAASILLSVCALMLLILGVLPSFTHRLTDDYATMAIGNISHQSLHSTAQASDVAKIKTSSALPVNLRLD